ncbi:hypothetical protein TRVA0_026S02168 [Trichomonascus vanleenenianus]|uniref:uncharacterized protein n=1 Tax=Trichomonascus vanleenenianus TaxID=2268995 RepID=UPI003ECA1ADD
MSKQDKKVLAPPFEADVESLVSQEQGSLENYLVEQLAAEENHEIKYRTCGYFKTAALLMCEYASLAMLSFPASFATLGIIPGLILTVGVSFTTLYTGLIIWEYCLKHPDVLDICDIGQRLFWNKKWVWWFTAVCLLLNNTFVQGLHILTGAKYLNTMTDHAHCTIVYTVIVTVVSFVASLPRTFSSLSYVCTLSAVTQVTSLLLCIIFAGVQSHPYNYDPSTPVTWSLWPQPGTTYVQGMNAFLNIVFTFVGQITYPSFIAEMRNPRDFKKSLYIVNAAEVVLYSIAGCVIYVYVGNEYVTSPAYGALQERFKKIAFSFSVPAIIFLGVLYASVSARFIFFRAFRGTRHVTTNTVVGWLAWASILLSTWVVGFIIAEGIPIFGSLVSLMCALFDCWFGYVFWGVAYIQLRRQEFGEGWFHQLTAWGKAKLALNVFFIIMGFYILGPGTYATIQSIIDAFKEGTVGGAFTCADNGI